MNPVIIGSEKSLHSPRVFLHRLGLTTTNTWNLLLQTIRVGLSCKDSAEDLPRHVAMVRVAPGSDVHLFWRARVARATRRRGWKRQRNNKLFLHSSYISVSRVWALRRQRQGKVTKHRRHGRDRGETDSLRDPRSHWRTNARGHARAVLAKDDGTYSNLHCCAPVPPRVRYRKCLHNTFCTSRSGRAAQPERWKRAEIIAKR